MRLNVPGIACFLLATGWAVALGVATHIIYEDGEFIGPQWMAIYTALVAASALIALLAVVMASLGRYRLSAGGFVLISVLLIGAGVPGYTFSWTGFSGFEVRAFLYAVLTPLLLLITLALAAALLEFRRLHLA
ncbi:MAG: hypothetical protein IIC82_07850 [Chloroflexi bacterium]|nr:hypothetical protein [Chloroflexota bacterium]